MCSFTVSTDLLVSLLVPRPHNNISNPNVSKHPELPPLPLLLLPPLEVSTMVLLLEWPSGRIEKPEGKRGTNTTTF
jgi:hypothetical protein